MSSDKKVFLLDKLNKIGVIATKHRNTVILSCLVLALLFAYCLSSLTVSTSPNEFLGKNNPAVKRVTEIEQEFVNDRNLFLMLRTRSGTILAPQHIEMIERITQEGWRLPHIKRVDSISNFQQSSAIDDDIEFHQVVEDTDTLSVSFLQKLGEEIHTDPRVSGLYLSGDDRATAINFQFDIELSDSVEFYKIKQAYEAALKTWQTEYPDIEFATGGFLGLVYAWYAAAMSDVSTLFPLALFVILVCLTLFFRSLYAGLATLTLAILSVMSGLAFVAASGMILHPPTVVGVYMILMLAIADAIHIINASRILIAQGNPQTQAIIESVRQNFAPVALTSITTAIGFASFTFSEFDGTVILGLYVAIGVMVAFLLSVTLLPALLCYCDLKPKHQSPGGTKLNTLGKFIIRWRYQFLFSVGPAALLCLYLLTFNQVDDSLSNFIKKTQPYQIEKASIEKNLTGTFQTIFRLPAGKAQGVYKPEFLKAQEEFVTWLRKNPKIKQVSSITDTLKHLNKNMHGDDPSHYTLPKNAETAAQYLLLYEMSVPEGLDLTTQINIDKSATRVVINSIDNGTNEMFALLNEIDIWLKSRAELKDYEVTGSTYISSLMIVNNAKSMMAGALLALTIIGGILLLAFRSIVPGILSVIMVITPILAAFGIWGVIFGEINVATSIALCTVIGIVVDNAVHFIAKYRAHQSQTQASRESSILYVYDNVGSAIAINTVVLGSGFGVLCFSAFSISSILAQLTVLCLALALLTTFTLLPCLLLIQRDKSKPFGFRVGTAAPQ